MWPYFVSGLGMAPVFGQISDPIAVMTDKASYSDGETIMITGEVKDRLMGQPVSIVVMAPNGSIVALAQVDVVDMMFSADIVAGGTMKFEGEYTVTVSYGSQARTAATTFTITDVAGTDGKDGQETAMSSLVVEGAEESVSYTITGGDVISMAPNVDDKSLVIAIDSTEDGSITLTLPKSVIDGIFMVLVDGEEWDSDMSKTDSATTVTIEFGAGTEEIELFGTFVIPEFGTIAALVLAVAIISIIAVTSRSRLSIMPRY